MYQSVQQMFEQSYELCCQTIMVWYDMIRYMIYLLTAIG